MADNEQPQVENKQEVPAEKPKTSIEIRTEAEQKVAKIDSALEDKTAMLDELENISRDEVFFTDKKAKEQINKRLDTSEIDSEADSALIDSAKAGLFLRFRNFLGGAKDRIIVAGGKKLDQNKLEKYLGADQALEDGEKQKIVSGLGEISAQDQKNLDKTLKSKKYEIDEEGKLVKKIEYARPEKEGLEIAKQIENDRITGIEENMGKGLIGLKTRYEDFVKDEQSSKELLANMTDDERGEFETKLSEDKRHMEAEIGFQEEALKDELMQFREPYESCLKDLSEMVKSCGIELADIKASETELTKDIKKFEKLQASAEKSKSFSEEDKNKIIENFERQKKEAEAVLADVQKTKDGLSNRYEALKAHKKEAEEKLERLDAVGKTPAEIKKMKQEKAAKKAVEATAKNDTAKESKAEGEGDEQPAAEELSDDDYEEMSYNYVNPHATDSTPAKNNRADKTGPKRNEKKGANSGGEENKKESGDQPENKEILIVSAPLIRWLEEIQHNTKKGFKSLSEIYNSSEKKGEQLAEIVGNALESQGLKRSEMVQDITEDQMKAIYTSVLIADNPSKYGRGKSEYARREAEKIINAVKKVFK